MISNFLLKIENVNFINQIMNLILIYRHFNFFYKHWKLKSTEIKTKFTISFIKFTYYNFYKKTDDALFI